MDLDEKWGPAFAPGKLSAAEELYQPRSLMLLSQHHQELRAYLELAESGFTFPQVVHQAAIILWVLDEIGEIRLAIEEQVSEAGRHSILLRDISGSFSHAKLGHPSLLEHGSERLARCGGEITWDGRLKGKPNWVISNRSGRYGMRDYQIKTLPTVVEAFSNHNIMLTGWFVDSAGKAQVL